VWGLPLEVGKVSRFLEETSTRNPSPYIVDLQRY
jgi:hypothetical protein